MVAVGGLDLDRLRTSPLWAKLPGGAAGMNEAFRAASHVLLASNGKEVLTIARGAFSAAPPGASLAAPGLALSGPPEMVRAASAQYRTGRAGVPDLVAFASAIAGGSQIWMAARGGIVLPLTGNAANINRLLRNLEFAGIAIRLDTGAGIRLTANARSTDEARQFEETLRSMLSLASGAESHRPEIAALLDSIAIERRGRVATATAAIPPASLDKLLELVPR
jgi:hypothetical protein